MASQNTTWTPFIYTEGPTDRGMAVGISHRLPVEKSEEEAIASAYLAMKRNPAAICFTIRAST